MAYPCEVVVVNLGLNLLTLIQVYDPKKHKILDSQGHEVQNVISFDFDKNTFEQILLDEEGNPGIDDQGNRMTIQRFGRLTLKEKKP